MYRNKKDVDKHVENLRSKLSVKEFNTRAYSVARLYFDVGDYSNCQKYVEQYLAQKDNNAAAHRLLGQALQKLGQKEKALDHYKTSFDIDPTQTNTILDICELLADDDLKIEPVVAQTWCKKAEDIFPKHQITFRLREKIVTNSNPDPEALVKLLMGELAVRPRDLSLHVRLLKHYININKLKEAFQHSCNIEFSNDNFMNDYIWYEILDELLKHYLDYKDWLYQLLLLTVKERLCMLSLIDTPNGISKSLVESNELVHAYDQALENISNAGSPPGFAEFHASLLQHHRGQFAFHAATLLLKKAKKDQLSWKEANKVAAPLMLIAWQTVPLDSKVNWLKHSSDKLLNAVDRWYMEGTYRCSQSGHYILSNFQDKNTAFLGQISQTCSGSHWKDKLYEKIFTNRNQLARITSSYLVSKAFNAPVLQFPRNIDVEAFDNDAQKMNGNSLHHFVWTIMNYKNFAHFKCSLFDMLTPTISTCGPETLDKLDIHAFLYCAALTARQQKSKEVSYVTSDKPNVLPANITDLLCSPSQMKWWDCAYKFSQNILGVELTDIRATLGHGIEVVRCVDNHGLDPELLCLLGRIFSEQAKVTTSIEEKACLEKRAALYYRSAMPLLEKLKSKLMIKVSDRRLFDYTHKELGVRELNMLIEETKMYIAVSYINEGEYDKAIDYLTNIKSVQAYYHLAQTYTKIAADFDEEITSPFEGSKSRNALLAKAKSYAYKALDMLKGSKTNSPLYIDVQEIIEEIEIKINNMDSELCNTGNVIEGNSSDENISYHSESIRPVKLFQNLSSTPKAPANTTNYKTAVDSQIFEMTRMDQKRLEKIENEIKNLQKRDVAISDYISQTRALFEENRKLSNQIINSINSNSQNTTDQFKLLKISVDEVKGQTDECRNDVGELKKQITDLKKEVNKLKKSSEKTVNENDVYNFGDDYRSNENSTNYVPQLPFPPHVLSQFGQRPPFPVPPNPYQLYNQSLYNLYNQYSQFAQTTSVPGAPPLFDSSRAQMNYPGVYPTPDQMYLDVAHLIPPNLSVPPVPVVSNLSTMPIVPTPHQTVTTIPSVSTSAMPTAAKAGAKTSTLTENKETPHSLPVNVVITSSDPLPTCVSAPTPVLSVTIPPKHIKNSPHNYQIAMPTVDETKMISPPLFSFSMPDNKRQSATTDWKQTFQSFNTDDSSLYKPMHDNLPDTSKTVVDGVFSSKSPNTSLNKSRTLSEKSNTSIENYDPCPDFKPIVPLPAEITVTTGEENEEAIFSARAKLFRFVDKQWKERGIGEMKLLKHKTTGKVRVLMRREQVHKICANHIITSEMDIQPMKNEVKAYFWVANDFADEKLVLEKFCVRFKTADIAKDFYDVFKKSSLESKSTDSDTPITSKIEKEDISQSKKLIQSETGKLDKEVAQPMSLQNKKVVGGFTFSSTPIFKSVDNDTKTTPNSAIQKTTNSPFSNIFGSLTTNVPAPSLTVENQDTPKSKLNTSDTVEEFEPNVEFKPVVPLPALVDTKTGEEDEIVIFEHRAKLLRFDANTKEWKERGLGNIKVLVHKNNNQKIRLLMRREQIMKVCCNHAITKEMAFQKMPNMDKAVTWCAQDFSDGELVAETFCLRFKTVKICDDFMEAIKTVQSKLKDNTKAAKEEQNATKQVNQSGFGDQFKAKPGSWYCDSCYTNNLESFEKCACCSQLKPSNQTHGKVEDTLNVKTTAATASSWGDQFKPKPGSWECQSCFIRNDAQLENCSACDSPKDSKGIKTMNATTIETKPNFNFGIPSQTAESISNQVKDKTNQKTTLFSESGFGDKFKPKEGSWECKQCFVRNENVDKCMACQSAKDPNVKTSTNILDNSTSTIKFRFGIPPTQVNEEKPSTGSNSIFDGLGAHKFTFGIPSTAGSKFDVETDQKPTAAIFAAPKLSSEDQNPLNFSLKNSEESNDPTATKPALLPTPQTKTSSFASKETGTFDFVFKPTISAKSPAKSPNKSQADDSDGEEYVKDEDCHAYFSPVIPMPEKVEVITGEENETELYAHRARLFIFVSGEWKERGTGIVRVLKHKDTQKLRVVMRREQVLKICLNHALTQDITYTPKDEKTWLFAANDFSEGELSLHQFCIRFQNKDVALSFKEAVDNARQGKPVSQVDKADTQEKDDDIIFVSQTQATAEEKMKAKELMLPENFYTYKNKDTCKGCRGCRDDDEIKPETTSTDAIKAILTAPALTVANVTASNTTPMKTTLPTFQSPINSVYGTPVNSDKTLLDTSLFRTPLGSIATNANSSTSSNNNDITINDATNKENFSTPKNTVNIFSSFGEGKTSSAINSPSTLFGGGDSQGTTTKTLIAPPKLNTSNTPADTKGSDAKTIFASAQVKSFGTPSSAAETKSMFSNTGTSASTSIFGFNADKPKQESNTEVRSIFGSNDQKPINLFSGATGSLFGPNSLGNKTSIFGSESSSSFGSGAKQTNVFQSMFSNNASNTSTTAWNMSAQNQPQSIFSKAQESQVEKESKVGETTLKVDNALSFAALSSSEPGFQKKDNFQWEGTGQQLFSSGKKDNRGDNDVSGEGGDAAAAEEEYDPHYEPIVPLPEKIVVTTGEEDEEKIFGERGKLYRYDDKGREWKERGVGEMKILYHPQRKTYRLLLRREQIHKAVLNMLIFMELELLPMKNSDRAWTWVARNYAESADGEQETLAVRFKSGALADAFRDKVVECTRKLQAAAAQAIREQQEAQEKAPAEVVQPLRLPKHLSGDARADAGPMMSAAGSMQPTAGSMQPATGPMLSGFGPMLSAAANGASADAAAPADSKQVTFQEYNYQEEQEEPEHDDQYDQYDYDAYYEEEGDDDEAYYACEGEAVVRASDSESTCPQAHIQLLFDQDSYTPRILVTDSNTGEILADMLVDADTDFQMEGDSCTWSGVDYTASAPADKTVTVNFYDTETAMQFHESCVASKPTSTYSSNDPES